jgi:peroxiredoxin
MKMSRVLSLIGLSAFVAVAAALSPVADKAKVGEAAPAFTLKDTSGAERSLKDYEGRNVVLQWLNYDCPVCRRVMERGVVKKMVEALEELDENIVILGINSTKSLDVAKTAEYLKKNGMAEHITALIDQDGTVGKLYDARTTPHMFVIDGKGVLRYNGAIDDDQSGSKGEEATNYVVNAVRQILAGETVTPDTTRPYGCSVKYAN